MPNSLSPQSTNTTQATTELDTFLDVVASLIKDPVKLRELVVKAGITTPTGELTAPYRGQ